MAPRREQGQDEEGTKLVILSGPLTFNYVSGSKGPWPTVTRCFAEIGPRSLEACVLLGSDVGQKQIRDLSVSLQPCTWSSTSLPMYNTFLSPSKIFCEKMASERKLCDVLAREVKSMWFLSARIQMVYGGYLNLGTNEGLWKSIS